VSNYNDGLRGGRVRVRAKISQLDKKLWWLLRFRFRLILRLWLIVFWKPMKRENQNQKKWKYCCWCRDIDSFLWVFHQIKQLMLFCFTACETSVAPRLCYRDKPLFVGVSHMLKISTERTQDLLRQNLKYNWRIKINGIFYFRKNLY
jgi:topoisomerase-4 subunit A